MEYSYSYIPESVLRQLYGGTLHGDEPTLDECKPLFADAYKYLELMLRQQGDTQITALCNRLPSDLFVAAYQAYKPLVENGLSLPEGVIEPENIKGNIMAYYCYRPHTVRYNIKYNEFVGKMMLEDYACVQSRWHSQPNTFLHEFGHHLHYHYGPTSLRLSNKKEIANQVSGYARTKYAEFMAECISAIISGRNFNEEVKDFVYPPVMKHLQPYKHCKFQQHNDTAKKAILDKYLSLVERCRPYYGQLAQCTLSVDLYTRVATDNPIGWLYNNILQPCDRMPSIREGDFYFEYEDARNYFILNYPLIWNEYYYIGKKEQSYFVCDKEYVKLFGKEYPLTDQIKEQFFSSFKFHVDKKQPIYIPKNNIEIEEGWHTLNEPADRMQFCCIKNKRGKTVYIKPENHIDAIKHTPLQYYEAYYMMNAEKNTQKNLQKNSISVTFGADNISDMDTQKSLILQETENIYKNGIKVLQNTGLRASIFERGTQEELRTLDGHSNKSAAATYIAERSRRTTGTQYEDVRDAAGIQAEELIEEFAKRQGFWYDNTDRYLHAKYGDVYAFGSEATVYFDEETSSVVKAIDSEVYGSILLSLYRIIIHNSIFPETHMEVLGFGRSNFGLFETIIRQPFIDGRFATSEEIDKRMEGVALKISDGEFYTERYTISDLKPQNAIFLNGGTFVIDAILQFKEV